MTIGTARSSVFGPSKSGSMNHRNEAAGQPDVPKSMTSPVKGKVNTP